MKMHCHCQLNKCYCTIVLKSKDQEHHNIHHRCHQHAIECIQKKDTVKLWSMLTMYRPLHYLIVCYSHCTLVYVRTRERQYNMCTVQCVRSFLLSCFRCHFCISFFFFRTYSFVNVNWFLRCCYHYTRAAVYTQHTTLRQIN